MDHTRDTKYDNPERGVLECLDCHLRRHVSLYFFVLLKGKKKEIREARFACMSLVFRIVAGEDRWDGKNIPNTKSDIKRTKKELVEFFLNKSQIQQLMHMRWVLNPKRLLGQITR